VRFVAATAAAATLTSIVTVPQHEAQRLNTDAPYTAVSGNGQFVALSSQDRLVPADTNTIRDVYVLDRSIGAVTLESVTPNGALSTSASDRPAISYDGRFLVFENGDRIIWRDRAKGTVIDLGAGREPAIDADGGRVAYTSLDGIMVDDVFTGARQNVSVSSAGGTFPHASVSPSLSADGRYVVFASSAPLLAKDIGTGPVLLGGGRRPATQVYIRDIQQGTTRLVSTANGVKAREGDSWSPVISADGSAVGFVSTAANLVKGDRNSSADIFLVNVLDSSIELVSRSMRGHSANGSSTRPAISGNGQYVVFQSDASDMQKPQVDINLLWDVFRFNRHGGSVTRLSTDGGSEWMEASGGPAIDASGAIVAFSSRHPISAADVHNDFDLFVLELASPSYYLGRENIDPLAGAPADGSRAVQRGLREP